jgi:hypothetical protein
MKPAPQKSSCSLPRHRREVADIERRRFGPSLASRRPGALLHLAGRQVDGGADQAGLFRVRSGSHAAIVSDSSTYSFTMKNGLIDARFLFTHSSLARFAAPSVEFATMAASLVRWLQRWGRVRVTRPGARHPSGSRLRPRRCADCRATTRHCASSSRIDRRSQSLGS